MCIIICGNKAIVNFKKIKCREITNRKFDFRQRMIAVTIKYTTLITYMEL